MEQATNKALTVVKPYGETEIEAHAAKVGGRRNLKEIVVTTDDDYAFYYLVKKPSKSVMQAIVHYESKKDYDGIQKLAMGCVLEGDREAYEHDGGIYLELSEQIGRLVNKTQSEIKKL